MNDKWLFLFWLLILMSSSWNDIKQVVDWNDDLSVVVSIACTEPNSCETKDHTQFHVVFKWKLSTSISIEFLEKTLNYRRRNSNEPSQSQCMSKLGCIEKTWYAKSDRHYRVVLIKKQSFLTRMCKERVVMKLIQMNRNEIQNESIMNEKRNLFDEYHIYQMSHASNE